ncbi:unnamed protein product [Callosobruchus maculatus]|uniref:Uncharacterized protein n=1 Tax=Callosobruchus maculatus TaxID=64391 RepID=A0A653C5D8_CALMS|nr:unnamed protein product [Callosobruchus maculatus]
MVRDRRRHRTCVALTLEIARCEHDDTSRARSDNTRLPGRRLLFCRSATLIGFARLRESECVYRPTPGLSLT